MTTPQGTQTLSQSGSNDEIIITWIGMHLGSEVGNMKGFLFGLRVVPDGRVGSTVYARTLRPGEADDGRGVRICPGHGEQLQFREGAILISLPDVDRYITRERGGLRITNTLWTWFVLSGAATDTQVRYFTSAARRLDCSHSLWDQMLTMLEAASSDQLSGILLRDSAYGAVGRVEVFVVALHRALRMVSAIPSQFSVQVAVPPAITSRMPALASIRNAYEHIDDRAQGNIRGKPDPDALSIFGFESLFEDGVIRYSNHEFDLRADSIQLITEARAYLLAACAELSVPVSVNTSVITFFPLRHDG